MKTRTSRRLASVACFGVPLLCTRAAFARPATAPLPLPKADGYHGLWYFNTRTGDDFKSKYSGGFATYPQQHIP